MDRNKINEANATALKAYKEAIATAWKAYNKATAKLKEEVDHGQKQD